MKAKIKKLYPDAKIPVCGTPKSSGYDLYAYIKNKDGDESMAVIAPKETMKIGTGIAIAPEEGYHTLIFARSGLATKEGLRPANCVGLIDEDYRGELIVALHNDSDEIRYVKHGERIAQLVAEKRIDINFIEVEKLDETERGSGGFSSTGK